MNQQHRMKVSDSSAIGAARRLATQLAMENAADETQSGRVAIVASELATNLVRHAGKGELFLQVLKLPEGRVLELIAVDRGPGMSDTQRCLSDGYSTGGTSGNGLGAILRLSQFFDLYSLPERGTVIVSRVAIGVAPERLSPLAPRKTAIGAICRALDGETTCGDAWQWAENDRGFALMMADGLGHGLLAHEASLAAVVAFEAAPWEPEKVLTRAHEGMSSTRGGSVACAMIDYEQGRLSYAGVGNISGTLLGQRNQGLVSHNGTVGAQMRRLQSFTYAWSSEQVLVMHSDGVSARWKLSDYPGLGGRHPAVIAAILFRDFGRDRDDATIVVVCFEST